MSQKAVISRRDVPKLSVRSQLREVAETLGITLEQDLPQGTLIRFNDRQSTIPVALGYRIRYVFDKQIFTVVWRLPRVVLVLKKSNSRRILDARGYRVKTLSDTNLLKIGSYVIDAQKSRTEPEVPANLIVPAELTLTWPHHLVQLVGPPINDWIHEIERLGTEVIEPVSPYGLHVVASPGAVIDLKSKLDFVTWVGPLLPAYRIDAGVLGRKGPIRLNVSVYPQSAMKRVKDAAATLGATIVRETLSTQSGDHRYSTLIVDFGQASDECISALARLPSVRWLEAVDSNPGLDGERDTQIIAGDATGTPGYQRWLTTVGFTGVGVTVAIADRGVDTNKLNNTSGHPDLRGRQADFIDYSGDPDVKDTDGHGTLVASIAVGNAATGEREEHAPEGFLLGQGVAPGARFLSQNFLLVRDWPPDLTVLTRDAVNHGAQVLNISWNDKDEAGAGYTANARILDQCVRNPTGSPQDTKSLTIVASAGNQGPAASRIMPPKEAKNLIVVGASLSASPKTSSTRGIWFSSSRGPAVDGRILPTVVAPGTEVTGAYSSWSVSTLIPGSSQYVSSSGTSLASPFVAGCCALLIEWWRSWHNGQDPSPAMLKALLINGADDLVVGADGETGTKAHIPNCHQGWGRVNLRNILEAIPDFPGAKRGPRICFDQDNPFTAESDDFVVCVEAYAQARPLRITLVWTDAPGTIKQNPALVNDLDLEVTNLSTNASYRGNQFENGFSVPGLDRDFDALNNVECVYIEHPIGEYEVRVIPASLTRNARPPFSGHAWQDFALVIDNAKAIECST